MALTERTRPYEVLIRYNMTAGGQQTVAAHQLHINEVLKDGASAIYGTDAIGGVINFIIKKNYKGLEARAFADVTEAGGGNIQRYEVTGGFGDLQEQGFTNVGVFRGNR